MLLPTEVRYIEQVENMGAFSLIADETTVVSPKVLLSVS